MMIVVGCYFVSLLNFCASFDVCFNDCGWCTMDFCRIGLQYWVVGGPTWKFPRQYYYFSSILRVFTLPGTLMGFSSAYFPINYHANSRISVYSPGQGLTMLEPGWCLKTPTLFPRPRHMYQWFVAFVASALMCFPRLQWLILPLGFEHFDTVPAGRLVRAAGAGPPGPGRRGRANAGSARLPWGGGLKPTTLCQYVLASLRSNKTRFSSARLELKQVHIRAVSPARKGWPAKASRRGLDTAAVRLGVKFCYLFLCERLNFSAIK
jgi:hypothetical protein